VIFFVTSVIGSLISGHAVLESRSFLVTHAGSLTEHSRQEQIDEVGQTRRELVENFLYFLSGITFSVGSILFLPSVYDIDGHLVGTEGTALFLTGSLLLAMAAYVNSLSVVVKGTLSSNPLPVQLGIFSLFTTLAGSILYSMGSMGYFPEVGADESEWPAWGTALYIIGAVMYVMSGGINLLIAYIKKVQDLERKAPGGRLIPAAGVHADPSVSKASPAGAQHA